MVEYNPFHLGHLYHIRKSLETARADSLVAVISSNFVQRGEPAMIDKGVRAMMALSCGVDLVLELPVAFSSHNAGPFSDAAVDILAATGQVDVISFGMETPREGVPMLLRMADILNDEPHRFKFALKKNLSAGYSFVQARSASLEEIVPGSEDLLKQPNNNLALSYVKRIREKKYRMEINAVGRSGAGHNEIDAPCGVSASAAAIRCLVSSGRLDAACSLMPAACADLLREARSSGHAAADGTRLWTAIKQALVRTDAPELSRLAGMGEGLENRMIDMAFRAGSYESFLDSCTSRRYPRGRIRRYCAHLLLNLSHSASREFQSRGPAYIRVLGANARGREILALMRHTATLPVISRSSAPWGGYPKSMMQLEHRASELWETLTDNPRPRAEALFVPLMTDGARPGGADFTSSA